MPWERERALQIGGGSVLGGGRDSAKALGWMQRLKQQGGQLVEGVRDEVRSTEGPRDGQ